ncbi:MAG: AraC family transcriptional regulator [Defluviitaleaceae bacterium]|nr:AraC family transcriptional regulator [Defluviitaleaceae bacterium]
MDWLKGMNDVIEHIEESLTQPIQYESLSHIVGCSVYEFSRIFSFMAGMSISEYIRRRRLSQAVFDIQNGNDKIIDIALKYCYESPNAFSRAFKEMHDATPLSARKTGISLKTYPPISFALTIKGVSEMNFRIEKRDSFQIMGLVGEDNLDSKTWGEDTLPALWRKFMNEYNPRLRNNGGDCFYTAPLWQVGAYDFEYQDGKTTAIIGAEYKGVKLDGMSIKMVPAATWAVFTITSPTGAPYVPEAWTRVITEWFPTSQYVRDESAPSMEVFPDGDASSKNYEWEIWMPVLNK